MSKLSKDLRGVMVEEHEERRKRRAQDAIASMSLYEIRKEFSLTQAQVAQKIGVSQSHVSNMEKRGNIDIRILARFVEAMGGSLNIIANFPQRSVYINDLNER